MKNNSRAKRFEDLAEWQQSLDLVEHVYRITSDSEDLVRDRSLVDQLRRSAVSATANIAEGHERRSKKENLRFLSIAKGSAGEVRSLLNVAYRVGHIDRSIFHETREIAIDTSKMIAYRMQYLDTSLQLDLVNKEIARTKRAAGLQTNP